MAVSIAEYLGQRTDSSIEIEAQLILPEGQRHLSPSCPFNGTSCSKMSMQANPKFPVCSLRRNNGQFYIVCEHRLISTKSVNLTNYQRSKLLEVSRFLFAENLEPDQVAYKSEVRIQTGEGHHTADFVLAVIEDELETYGPRRLLVEIQGGGETSNTGSITAHIQRWMANQSRSNEQLRQNIREANTIQTNAWRRLQEQLLAKATTARKSGENYGFVMIVGEVIMDYISTMLPQLSQKGLKREAKWDIAFVVYSEVSREESTQLEPVKLEINSEKSLFLDLEDLFLLMINRGQVDTRAFSGTFQTLNGQIIQLD